MENQNRRCCFSCGQSGNYEKVGRRDSCNSCSADLHVCYNCNFYDATAYNECREPQADRVLEKGRSNFCDYFSFRIGEAKGAKALAKSDKLKALDDLFKK